MSSQRLLPFLLPETRERFEARLRDAELLDQQAAQLLSQHATLVQQERNRREAERLRGQAQELRSFQGQQRLIESLQHDEMHRIFREGALVYRWSPFHSPAAYCWFERCVIRWSDGRLFLCVLRQDEIWESITHKKQVAGMDGSTYESEVTERVFTGKFRQRVLCSVAEGLSQLSSKELDEVEPYL